MNKSIWRSAVVIALALPGAVFGGIWGALIVSFAGDANPPAFLLMILFVCGISAGVILGALPGLLAGLLLQVRWVLPFLGLSVGIIAAGVLSALADGKGLPQFAFSSRIGSLLMVLTIIALPLVGLAFGLFAWRKLARRDREHSIARAAQTNRLEG